MEGETGNGLRGRGRSLEWHLRSGVECVRCPGDSPDLSISLANCLPSRYHPPNPPSLPLSHTQPLLGQSESCMHACGLKDSLCTLALVAKMQFVFFSPFRDN